MFCAKCGRKLSGKECKNCGASAEIVDRCGGFFDLIDQEAAKPQAAPMAAGGAPMVPRHDVEQLLRRQKEEVEEEMKGKALIVVSALAAVLLVIVLVLSIVLINSGNDPKIDVDKIAESVGNEVNNQVSNFKVEIPGIEEPKVCTCEEGTPTECIPYKGECRHEVFCAVCHASKGDEHCDTADGEICMACNQIPEHKYGEAVPAEDDVNEDGTVVKKHKLTCSECGEETVVPCSLNDEGKCTDCGNQCEHDMKLEGEKDSTKTLHTEKCALCGFTKNVPTPTDGTACTTCGEVWDVEQPAQELGGTGGTPEEKKPVLGEQ